VANVLTFIAQSAVGAVTVIQGVGTALGAVAAAAVALGSGEIRQASTIIKTMVGDIKALAESRGGTIAALGTVREQTAKVGEVSAEAAAKVDKLAKALASEGKTSTAKVAKETATAFEQWVKSLSNASGQLDLVGPKLEFLHNTLAALDAAGQSGNSFARTLREELEKLQPVLDAHVVAFEEYQKSLDDAADRVKRSVDPMIEAGEAIRELDLLLETGRINWEEYSKALTKVGKELETVKDPAEGTQKALESIADAITAQVGTAFNSMIDNIGQAKVSFGSFAESFLKDMAKIVIQIMVMEPLVKSL
jgi:chromosome segregation ATPase